LTLDLMLTGSGAGNGVGTGWLGAVGTGSCELTAAGLPGPPAQAARVVASKTAPAAPESLRMVVIGISIPMSDNFSTVGAPAE
jgi:hypothetical protein